MNDCQDCERTREMLLEILRDRVTSRLYDDHSGPSVTNEDLMELLTKVIKELEVKIDALS